MSPRSYDVRVVALTIDSPAKWVDNLLSHHDLPGCSGGKQGVARRITDTGLTAIAIVRLLSGDLGIPVSSAVALVRDAGIGSTGSDTSSLRTASGVRIELPPGFAGTLRDRLLDALQAAPRRPRGRPPRER